MAVRNQKRIHRIEEATIIETASAEVNLLNDMNETFINPLLKFFHNYSSTSVTTDSLASIPDDGHKFG